MEFKSLKIIKDLENQLQTGYSLSIFKGYVAINKRGVEKLIDELYANLPEDVKEARTFLKNRNYEFNSKSNDIYDNLKALETNILDSPIKFANYVILNIKETEQIIDKVYDTLPEEITKAKSLDKQ